MKKPLLKIALGIAALTSGLSSFAQTYTFTNCGATGRFGPNQTQVNATYTGGNTLTGNVTINTQGVQEWTVPATGNYSIESRGAQGGNAVQIGGRGAVMSSEFSLTAGQVLRIVVGQQGTNSINSNTSGRSGGGGGGSYAVQAPYNTNGSILVIAGGGGGAGVNDGSSAAQQLGVGGVTTTNGTVGSATGTAGGTAGGPGAGGSATLNNGSSAGAGFFGNSSPYTATTWATAAFSFVNGSEGSTQRDASSGAHGGFGGAGAGAYGGGGGGGYSGGGSGGFNPRDGGGGAGGSYNAGTNPNAIADANTGMGSVIITSLCVATVAPTITTACPTNITINNDAGTCGATVTYTAPAGTDDCGAVAGTLTAGFASGATFPLGTTTVSYDITNVVGTTSCSFTVTVVDAEDPTIACPVDITINTDAGFCTSTAAIGTATGTDNCAAPTITNDAPSSFPIGNTTVTWTSTDAAANAVTCMQVVTVVDNQTPTISCPSNTTSCDTIVTGIAPLSTGDNCLGEFVTYTLSGATTGVGTDDASGSTFNVGTTTVQYLVTDSAGNSDNCSFDVTVHPQTTISITPFNPDTICWNATAVNLPVVTPAGGIYSGLGVVDTMFNPDTSGVGTHYIVYTFTDANSCVKSDSTMIVVDLCTGVNENKMLNNVNIYPNPTSGLVHINLRNNNGSINYTISTIEGRIVNQESNVTTNQMTVDLSNESKGIYFLKIDNNTSSKVYKIIRK
jgi:hypothetical protein